MCKYCKKLKEIKDLEVSDKEKIISKWRLRDLEARKIISLLCEFADMVGEDTSYMPISEFDRCQRVLSRAYDFLNSSWIEK